VIANHAHGAESAINVFQESVSMFLAHRFRFTITWPATIARVVAAINGRTCIYVPVGAGGTVLSVQSVRLSFLRRDGGARMVVVGGVLDRIIVGHTRPLVDLNGRVLKLLSRITQHRCQAAGTC